ncbi:hypothetical protein HNR23_004510 [Nocardiopsis mwathae]|uniref:DUF5626 domain-containing protein n=2 Tax=Nocardiopsis mwathae TaxID=1472723 RepID=A0A7W9YLZ6_9ACTN|nr:hypothetical protein [Nocardiopsis mwathae]
MNRKFSVNSRFKKALIVAAVSMALPISSTVPAIAQESPKTVYEQEIIITNEHEILEVGKDKDVESVEEFVRQQRKNNLGSKARYEAFLTNGTLRIDTLKCQWASVDYFKHSGSTISAKFGARQYNKNQWSNSQRISAGGRGGGTFKISSKGPGSGSVQGLMRVGSDTFKTKIVPCK